MIRQLLVSALTVLAAAVSIFASTWQNLISDYELQIDAGVPRLYRVALPVATFFLIVLVLWLFREFRKFRIAIGITAAVAFVATVTGMLSDSLSIGGGGAWLAGEALSVVVGALLLLLAVLPAFTAARTRLDSKGAGTA